KQRETMRGRAQLRLGELAALWNNKPENRRLPSLLDYARIRLLTRKRDWTSPERKLMRAARRHYAVRGLVVAAVVAGVGWGVWDYLGRLEARNLRERLLTAESADVPGILQQMATRRGRVEPLSREAVGVEAHQTAKKQLRLSLGLAPWDADHA